MERQRSRNRTLIAERVRLVWMWLTGLSVQQISSETGASVTTVYRWLRRWQEEGTLQTKSYRRAPRRRVRTSTTTPEYTTPQPKPMPKAPIIFHTFQSNSGFKDYINCEGSKALQSIPSCCEPLAQTQIDKCMNDVLKHPEEKTHILD